MLKILLVLQYVILSINAAEKRLILDEPDAGRITQINQIENTIQLLTNIVQKQTATIQKLTNDAQKHSTVMQQLNNTIQTQSTTIEQLQLRINAAGSTYIRWGRTSCPNNTELVYSGYVGGGHYNRYGSAAEYVCLTHEPVFGPYKSNSYAWMYGGEYEYYFTGISQQDVPCAVCLNKNVQSSIMIPGRNACYGGWHSEYRGVLVSGKADHRAASAFICLDEHREIMGGGAHSEDGKLLFTVAAKCGTLKCPPYKNNYELTCVVCSK